MSELAEENAPAALTALVITDNWIDGGVVSINVGTYTTLGTIDANTFGDNQKSAALGILLNNPRADIGLTIGTNLFKAVDRPLANPALAGTTLVTNSGIHGG